MARQSPSRRAFLAQSAAIAGAAWLAPTARLTGAAADAPLRVAAVITEFTYRSHAHVILENFVQPYLFNGRVTEPGMTVAGMYVDQFPEGEMARDVSRRFNIPIYPTIAEALTDGGRRLAVDAVLLIGEHGTYPKTEKGQIQYPRKAFFDQVVAVFKDCGRGVPVFNDKHLSYRWDWAREMYDTARAMNFPLMAGSSVPLATRRPPLELPAGAPITEAVSIHGGPVESYDFHGLEVLQSLVEGRAGGETGVTHVQFLEGEPLWQAAAEGRWSPELAAAAMAAELGPEHEITRYLASGGKSAPAEPPALHGILIDYTRGPRSAVLKVGQSSTRWNFACRLATDSHPKATAFYVGPWQNRNLFKALSHAIQTHFRQQQAPYPVERTLLTTGMLAAAMDSKFAGNVRTATPELAPIQYAAQDFRAMREMGATWQIITEDMPEPSGIVPVGIAS